MLRRLRQILLGEKGQGLTEWALVALFVVVLFYIFRESNILPQVTNTYNRVGGYLSSVPTAKDGVIPLEQALNQYGTMSNAQLQSAISNAERIAMDDATLRNLAGAFLGKTQDEIRAMLTGSPRFDSYKPDGALNQGNLLFDYYINGTGDGDVKTSFKNGLVSKNNLINWMQGDYSQSKVKQSTMESNNRYFFSDDLIDPKGIVSGTPPQAGDYAVSVRCSFEFDPLGRVKAVQIWATRNKEDSDYPPNTNHWVRSETAGLGLNGKMNIRVE